MPDYQRISDFFARPTGKVMGTIIMAGLGPVPEPKPPEQVLSELTNESDAVIKGMVISKTSQITEDDGFIFTDYDVLVTEVLRDNPVASIESGKSITVTRPGGKVTKDGIVVKAIDRKFLPLSPNTQVLLFLKFIPETGAYKPTRATGSFQLEGSLVHSLTDIHLSFEPKDETSLLQTARRVSIK